MSVVSTSLIWLVCYEHDLMLTAAATSIIMILVLFLRALRKCEIPFCCLVLAKQAILHVTANKRLFTHNFRGNSIAMAQRTQSIGYWIDWEWERRFTGFHLRYGLCGALKCSGIAGVDVYMMTESRSRLQRKPWLARDERWGGGTL